MTVRMQQANSDKKKVLWRNTKKKMWNLEKWSNWTKWCLIKNKNNSNFQYQALGHQTIRTKPLCSLNLQFWKIKLTRNNLFTFLRIILKIRSNWKKNNWNELMTTFKIQVSSETLIHKWDWAKILIILSMLISFHLII